MNCLTSGLRIEGTEMAAILLSASAALCAMLLGVVGVLVTVREMVRRDPGASAVRRYQQLILIVLGVLAVETLSVLCFVGYLCGLHRCLLGTGLVTFTSALVASVVASLWVTIRTYK